VGLKVSILGPQIAKRGFSPLKFCKGARMNTNIGDKIFQDTPCRMAKICENPPRDVEKSGVKKRKLNNTTSI